MGMARIASMAPSLGPRLLRLALLGMGLWLAVGCGGGGQKQATPPSGPAPLAWSHALAVTSQDPKVAFDATGQGLAVWVDDTPTFATVQAQWMVEGSIPVTLSNPAADAWVPKVITDGPGGAVVVWEQYDGGTTVHVWARRWTAGGWSSAVQLSQNAAGDASEPQLASDGHGNAWVLWHEGNGIPNHFDVWGAHLSAGTWASPVRLSDGAHSAFTPHLAMNDAGAAIALWVQAQDDGSTSNGPQDVWASALTSGLWSAPVRVNGVDGAAAWAYGQSALAMDPSGRAVAVWNQVDASGLGPLLIWGSSYTPGVGWSTASLASAPGIGDAYSPDVAIDANGNALAVWQQQDGFSAVIAASRKTLGQPFDPPANVSSGADAYDPHVVLTSWGAATAVWYQMEAPGFTIRTSAAPTTVWSPPLLIDSLAVTPGLYYPVTHLTLRPDGSVSVVWGVDSM